MSTSLKEFNAKNGALIGTTLPNYLQLLGGDTGNAVSIRAQGTDTNISIALIPKGNGTIAIPSGTSLVLTNGIPSGVLYLDSSKVMTSSSNLLFDGTNLNTTGNVGIGTSSVASRLSIKGTTTTDAPTLGTELLTGGTWTSTGWTGNNTSGWINGASNATALSYSVAAVIGTQYQIAYTVTSYSAGSFTVTFGGQSLAYITATGTFGPTAITTGNLVITPTATFVGTIIISVKAITAGSTALVSMADSSGISTFEVRASSALHNTFLGLGSGRYNTTGISNTANGAYTLINNTTGSGNTASGANALYYNTTGIYNTASGGNALLGNTTGSHNTASGVNALLANTTGNYNTASGWGTLGGNTTGIYNTASGTNALLGNTTGNYNTASGTNALLANTSGYDNTAVGNNALRSNSDTYHNVAIGSFALMTSTSDLFNTAIGTGSLKFHDGGDRNTGCGTATLFNHLTGNANTAVGCDALYTATSGDSNTAVGGDALYSNISGSANTAVGRNSGRSITGSNNVILGGYQGGATPISATGNNFIVLSDGAGTVRQTHNASGALAFDTAGTAFGTSGQVLQSNGNAAVPTWVTPAGATISDSAPATPSSGSLWWDSTQGRTYIYYTDSNTSQWVDASPSPASSAFNGGTVTSNISINNSSPTIFFQDTDQRTCMLQNNSNLFYILRGDAANSITYSQYNSYWPMQVNLANNDVTWGGNITAVGTVTQSASDKRLKDNIVEIPNAIEKIKKIRGVTFDWNDTATQAGFIPSSKNNEIGVIAQEIEEVLPQVVRLAPFDTWSADPDTKYSDEELAEKTGTSKSGENYKTVQYERIVPLLIQAIKEQQEQIEAQQLQIDELKLIIGINK